MLKCTDFTYSPIFTLTLLLSFFIIMSPPPLSLSLSLLAESYAVRGYGSSDDGLFIHLDDVSCSGTERNLSECGHNGISVTTCSVNELAAVICTGENRVTSIN